jgi:hypothetical protein
MIQFKPHPIYILYSLHRQKSVEPLWGRYYNEQKAAEKRAVENLFQGEIKRFLRDMEIATQKDAMVNEAIRWQLEEDLSPKYDAEIKAYEQTIVKLLRKIEKTQIGKMVLGRLGGTQKIWIIPANWTQPTAKTQKWDDDQGGGIRISFNPGAFKSVYLGPGKKSSDESDETLLHELVHAMRYSQGTFGGKALTTEYFLNSEEFIATMIENVYHSAVTTEPRTVYSTYQGPYKTKKEMYDFFVEYPELIMALKHFIDTEDVARQAALMPTPDFNPFRDHKKLEARALKAMGGGELMKF